MQLVMRHKPLWWVVPSLTLTALAGCKQPDAGGTGGNANSGAGGGGSTAVVSGVSPAKPYTGDDILLGEYGSLTGSTATFGKSSHSGIMMAVDEANARGGVLGKNIRVQTEDNQSQPEQAATAVKKLINQNNVLAVLGEVASSRSLAAAPICQAAGVPMISPSSTNPEVTKKGDYIFRTCFIDPFQGTVGARFALDTLKARRAAVLTDVKNDYSVGLSQYFIEEFKKSGEVVAEESYSEGDTDFRAQLTNIKGKNPDVIFIPGYYTEVGNIAVQARSLGLKQPLLGGDGWDSPKLAEIGKDAVQGSYFSNHYSADSNDPRVKKFVADFQKRYKERPDALAAVAYDAANIMIDAIKRAGNTDRAKIRDAIAATKNFPGVTGNITIDQDRNAVKPAVILKVQGNKFEYVTTVKP
jgi:branched-chain amino acid transport system substrate-binding protein